MILNLLQYKIQIITFIKFKTCFWIKNTLVAMKQSESKNSQKQAKYKKINAKYHFPALSSIVSHLIKYGWSFINSCLVMNLI